MLDGLQDNELQYQHNKLQELHKTLQTQLADVDEANVRLHTEFHSLQEKICKWEASAPDPASGLVFIRFLS